MALPDFSKMSLDELIAYKRELKEQQDAIRKDAKAAGIWYNRRVDEMHVAEAVKQVEAAAKHNGRTPVEQAHDWLQAGDDGHKLNAARFLGTIGGK